MGEFGRYTTEEIDAWQKNPAIRSILTSPMMGAWLMRRDANIELQLGEAIRIPQNATNGDVIKAMFPDIEIYDSKAIESIYTGIPFGEYIGANVDCMRKWWNAPYERK